MMSLDILTVSKNWEEFLEEPVMTTGSVSTIRRLVRVAIAKRETVGRTFVGLALGAICVALVPMLQSNELRPAILGYIPFGIAAFVLVGLAQRFRAWSENATRRGSRTILRGVYIGATITGGLLMFPLTLLIVGVAVELGAFAAFYFLIGWVAVAPVAFAYWLKHLGLVTHALRAFGFFVVLAGAVCALIGTF